MKFKQSKRVISTFEKPEYLSYTYGQHRVRLLGEPRLAYIHFFYGRGSIECLGDDCPICERNREIKANNPNDFWDHPQYQSWSERHLVNGLDRTLAITCPECGYEMKADLKGRYPGRCTECDAVIGDIQPKPINKIKIVNLSKTNKEILELIDTTPTIGSTLEGNEPIGIENMDIIFMVTKSGSRKNISIKEDLQAVDKIDVSQYKLFNLDDAVITLTREETEEFMNGVSLKDIFTNRNAISSVPSAPDNLDTDPSLNAKKKVDELFSSLNN